MKKLFIAFLILGFAISWSFAEAPPTTDPSSGAKVVEKTKNSTNKKSKRRHRKKSTKLDNSKKEIKK